MKLVSPVKGMIKDIVEADDMVFSKKMLGDGVCVELEDCVIKSPVSGVVKVVFPTGHAIGLESDGVEILLHLGIDTVELNGQHFDVKVKVGDKVTPENELVTYDYKKIEKLGYDTDIMLVISSGNCGELNKFLGKKELGELIINT